ncbi:hypothetical protein Pen02_55770 [Plantactinospora endophytica]|uniref:Tat pathway signal sequence domain protein n=1 Tax=Plantactinospora endophytica TaxID=673535 RepID=A0ABQ4E7E2_9ACTN|nr:hypothetical protein Pen02_55770 [Plantactinospora endophytica]
MQRVEPANPAKPGSPWRDRAQRLRWGLGIAVTTAVVATAAVSLSAAATAPTPPPATTGPTSGQTQVETESGPVTIDDPTPGPAPAKGTGRDPITPDERAAARQVAAGALAAGTGVTGAAGPEYLSTELVDERSDGARRAAFYFYNYTDNTLVKQVVNLKTGKLENSFAAPGIQPPASARESTEAFRLFLASDLSADFKSRYRKATGADITDVTQVLLSTPSYVAAPADQGAQQCGKHRCLQLVPQVPGGVFIDISDIVVDLSGRVVARLK